MGSLFKRDIVNKIIKYLDERVVYQLEFIDRHVIDKSYFSSREILIKEFRRHRNYYFPEDKDETEKLVVDLLMKGHGYGTEDNCYSIKVIDIDYTNYKY